MLWRPQAPECTAPTQAPKPPCARVSPLAATVIKSPLFLDNSLLACNIFWGSRYLAAHPLLPRDPVSQFVSRVFWLLSFWARLCSRLCRIDCYPAPGSNWLGGATHPLSFAGSLMVPVVSFGWLCLVVPQPLSSPSFLLVSLSASAVVRLGLLPSLVGFLLAPWSFAAIWG